MAITASRIVHEQVQRDGRRWILEEHTDHLGRKLLFHYLASAGVVSATGLAEHAIRLADEAKRDEIAANISQVTSFGSEAVTSTVHSTAAENFAALRAAYLGATRIEAIMIADFLSGLSNAFLQTAFGMTAAQVTTLRTNKLTPAAAAATTIRAISGA